MRAHWQTLRNDVQIVEALKWSWRDAIKGCIVGALTWPIIVVAFGMIIFMVDYVPIRQIAFENLAEAWNQMNGGAMVWLINGLRGAIIGSMFLGITARSVEKNTTRIQSVPIFAGLVFAFFGGFIPWLGNKQLVSIIGGRDFSWYMALEGAVVIGGLAFLRYGGLDMIQHFVLRVILWHQGRTPRNYYRFLDYSTDHILLQKVGSGYIFIHRLLLEHFAKMKI